jgi:hypothetical protein
MVCFSAVAVRTCRIASADRVYDLVGLRSDEAHSENRFRVLLDPRAAVPVPITARSNSCGMSPPTYEAAQQFPDEPLSRASCIGGHATEP